ncbi:hypoxanthine phosphoribosyltransferase [candidate division KSB1 bacterium]|nr:hypoxanthine phosphoribosyltransferase [candidate division KSB1 bacterium]
MTIKIETIFSSQQIQDRIAEIADEIAEKSYSKDILLIGLLNGCYMFVADLARALYKTSISLTIDFMKVSSYGNKTTSSGEVCLEKDIRQPIRDKCVLIVDDIIDTGNSLTAVLQTFETHHPKSIQTCVLLDKPDRREVQIQPDYIGFQIPNEFVVGYGLDYAEQYRELPYIGILKI